MTLLEYYYKWQYICNKWQNNQGKFAYKHHNTWSNCNIDIFWLFSYSIVFIEPAASLYPNLWNNNKNQENKIMKFFDIIYKALK